MIQKIGKYQVLERIGRGGMGTVFKAHDPVLDRSVALKVISPDIEVTDALRTRFFREAQACARLNHRNIITVYDLAEVDGHLFIVMELLEGVSFRASADLYARAVPSRTPPSPPAIAPTPPPREGPIAPFAPNSAEAEIKTVLEQLKRAFATKDVAMVQRLRPGMSDEALRRPRETFDNARSYELELRVEALKIAGNEAQARTFMRDLMTAKDGQIHQSETTVTVVLKREAGGWRITDIK
jgi:Protein kinase domain/SnoaL-like domain